MGNQNTTNLDQFRFTEVNLNTTSLAATMVRWCEGGVNQGLLPMTISEEESNLFCIPFIEPTGASIAT
jgi:hypothetical protein